MQSNAHYVCEDLDLVTSQELQDNLIETKVVIIRTIRLDYVVAFYPHKREKDNYTHTHTRYQISKSQSTF